jgi:hypothetical protein
MILYTYEYPTMYWSQQLASFYWHLDNEYSLCSKL